MSADPATGATGTGLRIAITGGIGAGKSTVAALLEQQGALRFDADACSRSLTAVGGAALGAIRDAFGDRVFLQDGSLNREALRQLAFSDGHAKSLLEGILHPRIAAAAQEAHRSAGARPLVYDIPLLHARSQWRRVAQRVLVVDCPEAVQVRRIQQRSGLTVELIHRIMAAQLPRDARRNLADAVLFNAESSMEALEAQVTHLWRHWNRSKVESRAV